MSVRTARRLAGEPEAFDVCGPLPAPGVTVLEASAGTGKTFAIAALAARYVADGLPLERLLLITFTRMATGELRERVRSRLVASEAGLARVLAGQPAGEGDAVLALLAAGPPEVVARRRECLARGLAGFDAGTIATTHAFCNEVLGGLGVSGDLERGVALAPEPGALLEEVVDDLYVRRFLGPEPPDLRRGDALAIGRAAVENPFASLEPSDAPEDSPEAMRVRLARGVREELERRLRRAGVITYDGLLGRLRDTLACPRQGEGACARLRARFGVVLVDEFQDTDPVQWEILRRAFGTGATTLVLIGDPKQAIYAFRGADVHAYLDAARSAGTKATLSVNWRSDAGLIAAYDALLGGVRLGDEDIVYRAVRAAPAHEEPGLRGAPGAPLRVRVLHREDGLAALVQSGLVQADAGRAAVAEDLAADVVRLLSSGATVGGRGAPEPESRPVRPGDVAVLVPKHAEAALVREALHAVGVPAVLNGAGSVFVAESSGHWLRLLEALERPSSALRVHSAALTPFVGWSAERVAGAGEAEWEGLHARLHRWAEVLRRRGVASLIEAVNVREGLAARVLGTSDGERVLTDLRHLGELLHAEATAEQLGAGALTTWLRRRIAEAQASDEEGIRRLESDAEAVQVITIHRSKGLEFPVVYLPYLWLPGWIPEAAPVYHDPDAGGARAIDVGGPGHGGFAAHKALHRAERRGEELRLAYVALTRARHRAVVWWAAGYEGGDSPLARLLLARQEDGTVDARGPRRLPTDDAMRERLARLAEAAPGRIGVERVGAGEGTRWSPAPQGPQVLEAARFDRPLDTSWRRTSYSGITAGVYEARVASEAGEAVTSDEPPADEGGGGSVLPLDAMPAGADVGTFVHAVLERTDFAAADLDAELGARVAAEGARGALDLGPVAGVAAGLRAALETPLGPLVGDLRLRDVAPADRLDELAFELPLAGGDAPAGALAVADLAALLAEHVPPGDPLDGYAARLADPILQADLRGYLVGSVDLVIRIPHPDREPARFAIVDYKTNRLGGGDAYLPSALAVEMQRAHYPLQALLYAVALHRYLRWRLPDHRPERDLAGVLYLFVRGMTGPDTPRVAGQPRGVFGWRPPPGLVEVLSALLDRGRVAG